MQRPEDATELVAAFGTLRGRRQAAYLSCANRNNLSCRLHRMCRALLSARTRDNVLWRVSLSSAIISHVACEKSTLSSAARHSACGSGSSARLRPACGGSVLLAQRSTLLPKLLHICRAHLGELAEQSLFRLSLVCHVCRISRHRNRPAIRLTAQKRCARQISSRAQVEDCM